MEIFFGSKVVPEIVCRTVGTAQVPDPGHVASPRRDHPDPWRRGVTPEEVGVGTSADVKTLKTPSGVTDYFIRARATVTEEKKIKSENPFWNNLNLNLKKKKPAAFDEYYLCWAARRSFFERWRRRWRRRRPRATRRPRAGRRPFWRTCLSCFVVIVSTLVIRSVAVASVSGRRLTVICRSYADGDRSYDGYTDKHNTTNARVSVCVYVLLCVCCCVCVRVYVCTCVCRYKGYVHALHMYKTYSVDYNTYSNETLNNNIILKNNESFILVYASGYK